MKVNTRKFETELAKQCKSRADFINAGIPSMTYQNVRSGKDVRPETIGRITQVLGCDVTDILAD